MRYYLKMYNSMFTLLGCKIPKQKCWPSSLHVAHSGSGGDQGLKNLNGKGS